MTRLLTGLSALGLAALLTASLLAQGYSNTSPRAYWVPPGKCNGATSGAGAIVGGVVMGMTTAGASATPVVQARGSDPGTFTVAIICDISPPNGVITTGNGLAIVDAVLAYGQGQLLGTQVATLASGTFNGGTVFSTITYPVAGVGETASTVAPVRADAGTLLITPTAATFNNTSATAGAFFTVKFTPATPIAWKTDLKQLLLTVRMTALNGLQTAITSPGVLVHFRSQ